MVVATSAPGASLGDGHVRYIRSHNYDYYTPLLVLMHDVIILTQNEAMGALPPSLAVAAPIASF